jgi:hypothetical protein
MTTEKQTHDFGSVNSGADDLDPNMGVLLDDLMI